MNWVAQTAVLKAERTAEKSETRWVVSLAACSVEQRVAAKAVATVGHWVETKA